MKKLLLVLMVSVVLVSLVACDEEGSSLSAEEILNSIIDNQNNMESYRFDMDMTRDPMVGWEPGRREKPGPTGHPPEGGKEGAPGTTEDGKCTEGIHP